MAFDTSVSGILAASSNLGIIGNNIANGSTVGFKSSTGEFKDIYSQSLSGSSIGQGVALTSIKQDSLQIIRSIWQ
jgi:flagellar hook protein FlgE